VDVSFIIPITTEVTILTVMTIVIMTIEAMDIKAMTEEAIIIIVAMVMLV
jgi:hypothetical protein